MRYTGPRCRLCRQHGEKLFLKGARCETAKCPISKGRSYAPGQHQGKSRRKISAYGQQLRAKQKIRNTYQLSEKQFRLGFSEAARKSGATGENFARSLELRLDNVIYRAGLATSRAQARQLVGHGLFALKGKKVTIPSIQLREGDEITMTSRGDRAKLLEGIKLDPSANWLKADAKNKTITVASLPTPEDFDAALDFSSVIEFYSR